MSSRIYLEETAQDESARRLLGEWASQIARGLQPEPAETEQGSTEQDNAVRRDRPLPNRCDSFDSETSDLEWTLSKVLALTMERMFLLPSEWAERKRFLPQQLSSRPGFYRFAWAPYLKEPLDCLAEHSPVRELAFMKGAQIGATVGIIENYIGYLIEHVRTAPAMFITADDDVAKKRLELCVVPMLIHSGLQRHIRSADESNRKRSGRTATKLEWEGGGYMLMSGAKSPNNMISFSAKAMLRDEIDTWPQNVGKSGDPIALTGRRTAAYEQQRKIVDLSTPLLEDQSHIQRRFRRGDQRRYFVKCLKCGAEQELRWHDEDKETGEVTGIVWEGGQTLVPGSVRYLCRECGHAHREEDKERLLSEDNARWIPTAEPISPHVRSYHLSSLYSRFQTWEALVLMWLEAWDVEHNKPKDLDALQAFYNTVLGRTFTIRGQKVRFEMVSGHRRHAYRYGQVPNAAFCGEHCAGPVAALTCAVDVHGDNLAVAVFGWCRGRRAILVDYWRFLGDTEQLSNQATWGRLEKLIETKRYQADDGKEYPIAMMLIDAGYRGDTVYRFAAQYEFGVYPIRGRETPQAAGIKEFSDLKTPTGMQAFGISVDVYKDRWSTALLAHWDGMGLQPEGHFNAPLDADDKQLKELTVESRHEKIDDKTGKRLGWFWHRPSGAANELWDLLVYNSCALDLLAWDHCEGLEMDHTDWALFFDDCFKHNIHFTQ